MSISSRPLIKAPSFSILEDEDADVFLPGSKKPGDFGPRSRTQSDSVLKGKGLTEGLSSAPRRGLALSDSSNNPFNRSSSSSSLSSSSDNFTFKKPLARPKQPLKTSRGQSTTTTTSSGLKNIKRIGSNKKRSQSVPNYEGGDENSYPSGVWSFCPVELLPSSLDLEAEKDLFAPIWTAEMNGATLFVGEEAADLEDQSPEAFSGVSESVLLAGGDEDYPPIEEMHVDYSSPWDEMYVKEPPVKYAKDEPLIEDQPPSFLFCLDDRDCLIGCDDGCRCQRCVDEMTEMSTQDLSVFPTDLQEEEDCDSPDESMSR